jgi:hypothetical protein
MVEGMKMLTSVRVAGIEAEALRGLDTCRSRDGEGGYPSGVSARDLPTLGLRTVAVEAVNCSG